ncbi:hypothetical protein [Microbulbifer sp. YPW16]|uniref:hypothetical protein n=1 Tax=Microbulbifer sp. YPW16 TaxID=2904242 RepID=UPI001E4C4BD9|nr:hypothetical protein [Microbulbifer sp. YPW16]UHQ54772.1 hypothetical protein LVE68_14875 [Microbulbifer sp. YPW16]
MYDSTRKNINQSVAIEGDQNNVNLTVNVSPGLAGVFGLGKWLGNLMSRPVPVHNPIGESLLTAPRKALRLNRYQEAISLLENLVFDHDLSNFNSEVLSDAISLYCWALYSLEKLADCLQFLGQVEGAVGCHRAIDVWRAITKDKIQGVEGDVFKSLIEKYQDSAVLIYYLMGCDKPEFQLLAREKISHAIEDGDSEKLKKLSGPIQLLVLDAIARESFDEARAYLSHVHLDIVEDYLKVMLPTYLRLKEIIALELVSHNVHIPASVLRELHQIKRELLESVKEAEGDGYDYLEGKSLLVLAYALLSEYSKAVDVLSLNQLLSSPVDVVRTVALCYQGMEDWQGMVTFIDSLPSEITDNLHNEKFVALMNSGRKSEAEGLEVNPSVGAALNAESADLYSVTDKHYAIQLAVAKIINFDQREEGVGYLKHLLSQETSITERFYLAIALHSVGLSDESFNLLSSVFEGVEFGLGHAQWIYLKLLLEKNFQKSLSRAFGKIGEDIIFSDKNVADIFLNFTLSTKGPSEALEKLEAASEKVDSVFIKFHILHLCYLLNNHEKVRQWVSEWGVPENASDYQVLCYLQFCGGIIDTLSIYERLYNIYKRNGHRHEIQKLVMVFFFNPIWLDRSAVLADLKPDKESFAAYVLDDASEIILIDSQVANGPLTLAKGPDDVPALKSASVGDEVELEGATRKVSAIIHPYLWMRRHAMTSLSKRPEETGVFQLAVGAGGEVVEEFRKFIATSDEQRESVLQEVLDTGFPLALSLVGSDGNHLRAWRSVHEFAPKRSVNVVHRDLELDCLEGKKLILDPGAIYTIFCRTSLWERLEVSVVPSAAYMCHEFSEHQSVTRGSGIDDLTKNFDRYEISTIPAEDPKEEVVEILNNLDVVTKDSFLSCLGYGDRIFVTDDPAIIEVANHVGLEAVSTFSVIKAKMLDCHQSGVSYNDFAQTYIELCDSCFSVKSFPVMLLSYLLGEECPRDVALRFIDSSLREIPLTEDNVRNLAFSILIAGPQSSTAMKLSHMFRHLQEADRRGFAKHASIDIFRAQAGFSDSAKIAAIMLLVEAFSIPGVRPLGPPYGSAYCLKYLVHCLQNS